METPPPARLVVIGPANRDGPAPCFLRRALELLQHARQLVDMGLATTVAALLDDVASLSQMLPRGVEVAGRVVQSCPLEVRVGLEQTQTLAPGEPLVMRYALRLRELVADHPYQPKLTPAEEHAAWVTPITARVRR